MKVDMTPVEANRWYCDKAGTCIDKAMGVLNSSHTMFYDGDWPAETATMIERVNDLFKKAMTYIELGRAAREAAGIQEYR